jgi:hypothetical protein
VKDVFVSLVEPGSGVVVIGHGELIRRSPTRAASRSAATNCSEISRPSSRPPLRARCSFECLVGNCVGEDVFVSLGEPSSGVDVIGHGEWSVARCKVGGQVIPLGNQKVPVNFCEPDRIRAVRVRGDDRRCGSFSTGTRPAASPAMSAARAACGQGTGWARMFDSAWKRLRIFSARSKCPPGALVRGPAWTTLRSNVSLAALRD